MTKALTVIGGIAIIAVVAAYPGGAVLALALPLAVVLAIVWWLTDSSVAVGRARGRTWFDRGSESVGGWYDADQVAAAPEPQGPPTAEVVVKGARRADPRRVG
jgi:hypothetical protein